MCSCCGSVVDFLHQGEKSYTAHVARPAAMEKRVREGIEKVTTDLQGKKITVTLGVFQEALHKYLTRHYRFERNIFNYRQTLDYRVIRIQHLEKRHWEVLETLWDQRKKRHPLVSLFMHCDCPSDKMTLAYNVASMLPVVGGILAAIIGTRIILDCLTRAGMPDGRMGRVKWLLITATITEILSLLVATSLFAPLVSSCLRPFERVARMVEIHFLIVLYSQTHDMKEELEDVATKLGMADSQGLSDRLRGRDGPVEGKKRKGKKNKKRKRGKGGDSMV